MTQHTPNTKQAVVEFPVGARVGRWTIIGIIKRTPQNHSDRLARCDCGTVRAHARYVLRKKRSDASCGCAVRIRNGYAGTPEYITWRNMLSRCYSPIHNRFYRYGARGITVCERWRTSFSNFLTDMGSKPAHMSLDRIDNNGPYEPGNCRWVSAVAQSRNRCTNVMITYNGQTKTLSEWGQITGLGLKNISSRLRRGWSVDETLGRPLRRY